MCNQEMPKVDYGPGLRAGADEALAKQLVGGEGSISVEQASTVDYTMQRRKLANVALQLQALAQEGHSKNIYVVVHKHSRTLMGGIVVVEYGPFTLEQLVSWSEKLARFESFSFKFVFPRLDSY